MKLPDELEPYKDVFDYSMNLSEAIVRRCANLCNTEGSHYLGYEAVVAIKCRDEILKDFGLQ